MKKDFLTIRDLERDEINELFDLAAALKAGRKTHDMLLKNKTLGLIFEKPSNRTRVSFEVGMFELGGHTIYLGSDEIALGRREAIKDAAKVLSRYLDGVVIRTFSHDRHLEFAQYAAIPVINGLPGAQRPVYHKGKKETGRHNTCIFGGRKQCAQFPFVRM